MLTYKVCQIELEVLQFRKKIECKYHKENSDKISNKLIDEYVKLLVQ